MRSTSSLVMRFFGAGAGVLLGLDLLLGLELLLGLLEPQPILIDVLIGKR